MSSLAEAIELLRAARQTAGRAVAMLEDLDCPIGVLGIADLTLLTLDKALSAIGDPRST